MAAKYNQARLRINMPKCCSRRFVPPSEEDDEASGQATKSAYQSRAQLFWFSLIIGGGLIIGSIFSGIQPAASYLAMAAVMTGGYFIGFAVQWCLLQLLRLPLLSADTKSALRVFDGPLLFILWVASIRVTASTAMKPHISTNEYEIWVNWINYSLVLCFLWLVRRSILRTVLQGLVKKIVGVSSPALQSTREKSLLRIVLYRIN